MLCLLNREKNKMGKSAALLCAIVVGITLIPNGDADNPFCASPPDIDGAVTPHLGSIEHAIGTGIIYNCPSGYVSRNILKQISLCILNSETGRADWTVPDISCNEMPSPQTSDASTNDDCFCTYEYEDQFVKAHIEQKELNVGDKIKRGERVTVECTFLGMVLSWRNGLRLYGKATMICNTCQKWQRNDVPVCKNYGESDAIINFDDNNDILPGGIAIVQRGRRNKFLCLNKNRYPEWDYGQRKGVYFIRHQDDRTLSVSVSILNIEADEDELRGKYECYINGDRGQRLGSTFLYLQANDTEILCPPLTTADIFTLQYSNDRKIDSIVTFHCKGSGKRIKGSSSFKCLPNGTWSGRIPECVDVTCEEPQPPKHGTVMLHSDLKVRSLATYSCDLGRRLYGAVTSRCQSSGKWNFNAPECLKIVCSVPLNPVNGQVRYSSLEYGTELKYECNAGYKLKKHQPRVCSRDGTWSNDEPECIEATCEEPQPPKYGTVQLHGHLNTGSVATYSCEPDRKLYGATSTMCLSSGKWNFDAPECLRSCMVPHVDRGITGRYETVYTPRRTFNRFKRVFTGEIFAPRQTLLLRCRGGTLPVVNSEFVSNNLLEVTCTDGAWSHDLQCLQTRCLRPPPFSKTARPLLRSRNHGYNLSYVCRGRYTMQTAGNVTCHFGSWIGSPPTCSMYRKKRAIIPKTEELSISHGGAIQPNTNVESSSSGTNDTTRNRECVCTYEYEDPEVKLQIGRKVLKPRDTIKHGETISLECKSATRKLKWQNGLVFSGKAYMTCSTCRQWQREDLPTCSRASSDVFITYDGIFKILPGGIIDIKKEERRRYECRSTRGPLLWDFGEKEGVLTNTTHLTVHGQSTYVTYLDILQASEQHSGKYECFLLSDHGIRLGSTSFDLQMFGVTRCVLKLDPFSHLVVEPKKDGYDIGEIISLSCPTGEQMSKQVERLMCLSSQWSDSLPECIESEKHTSI